MKRSQKVAVIGAGPSGLAALKNLKEEGFDVTVIERRADVGGVWAFSDDAGITSTLPATISNVSKFGNSFTDFPIPDDFPVHPTAAQTCDYIKSYASHFDLHRHVQLNTSVQWIKRSADDANWQVCTITSGKEEITDFYRVVIATGLSTVASIPKFENADAFKGKILHVQAFKEPSDFKDMDVLVLGIGNSAADTSTQLIGHAKSIYLSHRAGVKILPRKIRNKPLDFVITRQKNVVKFALDRYIPALSRWLFDLTIEKYSRQSFKLDPAWRLSPAPSLAKHQPLITDNLVSSLWAKDIISVHGLRRFIGDGEVELTDGTALHVDAVILCTGYEPDFSIMPEFSPLDTSKRAGIYKAPLARLYQNIFPPQYADSLAYLNYFALTDGVMKVSDLATMALAQIWKGSYQLPPRDKMNAEIDRHHEWVRALGQGDSVYTGLVRPGPWYAFLDSAAGTGVDEHLGYGLNGWRFWWRERHLCNLMMRGVMTPFMYRFFEGRRKRWGGARKAIVHANEWAKAYAA
ncbi:dimethylaniline monooxygenase 2 [Drepanopeziza brunnea f. sp. 'multigermtubi' MB_m1]|uniref:Dimethylaniline monooxygenase 2 n=2 Tax=Drepanopeziza brunnea f. sp. 'multigermtubi' TaxID=698441 RepID=K1WC43_MARBU|nr:dimethylaniline monooxygenase 2 [Drepanopeziza brunnea f. sp. 'multigermtubi' MB_m1]EKD14955.1 dimethylaniline monooxygenase 2 [Drepanopeziza brunnea f. sp. 'multigermtubi' MB_m1]